MESALKKFYSDVAAVVKKDLEKQKMLLPPDVIAELCSEHHRQHRNCRDALFSAEARNGNAAKKIVCAVQKAFPQAGIVRNEYDFLQSAQYYEAHYHAAALAVFTEKHFYEGAPKMLTGITHLVKIPVIRWDFIVDEYQLMQSKLWGADAVRILPSLLDQSELIRFANIASELDLEFIIEAVDPVDIERSIIIENSIAAMSINTETPSEEHLQAMLKALPNSVPALCNGDCYETNQLQTLPVDGVLLSRKLDSAHEAQNFCK